MYYVVYKRSSIIIYLKYTGQKCAHFLSRTLCVGFSDILFSKLNMKMVSNGYYDYQKAMKWLLLLTQSIVVASHNFVLFSKFAFSLNKPLGTKDVR